LQGTKAPKSQSDPIGTVSNYNSPPSTPPLYLIERGTGSESISPFSICREGVKDESIPLPLYDFREEVSERKVISKSHFHLTPFNSPSLSY